jgi:hypothetical protein
MMLLRLRSTIEPKLNIDVSVVLAGSGKWRACLSVDTHRSPDAEAPSNLHKGISIHSTRGQRFSHRRKIHLSKEIATMTRGVDRP